MNFPNTDNVSLLFTSMGDYRIKLFFNSESCVCTVTGTSSMQGRTMALCSALRWRWVFSLMDSAAVALEPFFTGLFLSPKWICYVTFTLRVDCVLTCIVLSLHDNSQRVFFSNKFCIMPNHHANIKSCKWQIITMVDLRRDLPSLGASIIHYDS